MEQTIIHTLLSDACLFQPFRTCSDHVDMLTVRNGGHQYETWCLWDEFSASSFTPGPPRYGNGCILVVDDVTPRGTPLTKHERAFLVTPGINWSTAVDLLQANRG